MKKIILFSLLFATIRAMACSCAPYYSFCESRFQIANDVIVFGQILDTNSLNIRIKRFKTIEGIEQRDTIIVWNDSNINCNGIISMKASGIGNPGDSLIILLPRITSAVNTWDVVGDYRRPKYLCAQSTLKIQNDTVRGLANQTLNQSSNPPTYQFYQNFSITDFVAFLESNQGDCSAIRDSTFDYIPFPEKNVRWKSSNYYSDMGHSTCTQKTYTYIQDTLFNGKIYQVLKKDSIRGQLYMTCNGPYIYGTSNLFYRNDSINKKVYFIEHPYYVTPIEELAYDFNLKLGDTLPLSIIYSFQQSPLTIDSIDFVFEAGRYRRRYLIYVPGYSGLNGYETLIEGIGSSAGLIEDLSFLNGLCCDSYMDCITLNGTSYLLPGGPGGITQTCAIINNIDKEEKTNGFTIYPNPSTGILNIESEEEIKRISIYDMQGRVLKQIKGNLRQLELPTETGLYLLKISLENGNSINKKVLKQ